MKEFESVAGKRILVTGGTRGIGRAISLKLAEAGASVLANYVRNEPAAQELLERARGAHGDVQVCRADLTGKAGMDHLLETVRSWCGSSRLDGMVHCAATGVHRPMGELTARHFDWTLTLNTRAFLELTTRLLPLFATPASVVAISSLGAERATATYGLVGASKAALEALARYMAVELGPRGIRTNILCPGTVETEAWQALPNRDERLGEARRRSPIGRLVSPDEVACCALFLCSEASSGVNGSTLVVDGGEHLPL